MDWIMISTVTGTGLAIIIALMTAFASLYREIKRIENRLDDNIKNQSARSDRLYEIFQEGLKSQAERSDRLYDMFIDLLKERKA